MDNSIRINKYLPIAVLYFFFNSFLLPHGLLYTTLLTPVFLIWLYRFPYFNYVLYFFLLTLPFALVHFFNGVSAFLYLRSYLLLFSVFVFGMAFRQFLKHCGSLGSIFKSLTILNFFLFLLALAAFFIPFLRDRFWYTNDITTGITAMRRLKMLTYEPSYYSIMLVPVILYYFLKMLLLKLPNSGLTMFLLLLPLLFSLSFGIILGLLLSFLFLFLSDVKLLNLKKEFSAYLIGGGLLLVIVLFLSLQFYPDNVFFLRIANVLSGKDISFKGRTFDSFYLSWEIASKKSIWFGVGPGQVKPLGLDLFKAYYHFTNFTQGEVGIPNSMGDILATFGLLGVLIKLSLEVYFFFRTRVYSNFLRLTLFMFVFVYQFTGSFITNIAEYVIWIMAFSPWLFKEFDKENIYAAQFTPAAESPVAG